METFQLVAVLVAPPNIQPRTSWEIRVVREIRCFHRRSLASAALDGDQGRVSQPRPRGVRASDTRTESKGGLPAVTRGGL